MNELKFFWPQRVKNDGSFIGLDIGASSIKVVEIALADGKPALLAARQEPSPPGIWTEECDEKQLAEALGNLIGHEKTVITCIGGSKVYTRFLRLPAMKPKETAAAVRLELEKLLGMPGNELVIRQVSLDGILQKNDYQEILIMAVSLKFVTWFYRVFCHAGLTVAVIDLPAFALWRLFRRNSKDGIALVDIGAASANFVYIEDGLIRFLRSFSFSNSSFTEELARTLAYCQRKDLHASKIVMTGGGSHIKEMGTNLQNKLGLPVLQGKPQISAEKQDQEIDPVYSLALGLAIRDVCI